MCTCATPADKLLAGALWASRHGAIIPRGGDQGLGIQKQPWLGQGNRCQGLQPQAKTERRSHIPRRKGPALYCQAPSRAIQHYSRGLQIPPNHPCAQHPEPFPLHMTYPSRADRNPCQSMQSQQGGLPLAQDGHGKTPALSRMGIEPEGQGSIPTATA